MRLRRFIFEYIVKRKAGIVGKGLKVNHHSRVTQNTHLGNDVNFNGMKVIVSYMAIHS